MCQVPHTYDLTESLLQSCEEVTSHSQVPDEATEDK